MKVLCLSIPYKVKIVKMLVIYSCLVWCEYVYKITKDFNAPIKVDINLGTVTAVLSIWRSLH